MNRKKIIILGLGGLAILVAAVLITALFIKSDIKAGEVNENASTKEDIEEKDGYITLESYNLEFSEIAKAKADEIEEKIVYYFTYARPDLSSIKVLDIEREEVAPEKDDETLGVVGFENVKFILEANNKEKFRVKLMTDKNSYELKIYNARGQEIYEYSSDLITRVINYTETSDFLEAISIELPYEGKLDDGTEFSVFYDGDEKDRLTIEGADEEKLGKACKQAIEKAVAWANGVGANFSGEINKDRFICE